jgi:hypothetical protein
MKIQNAFWAAFFAYFGWQAAIIVVEFLVKLLEEFIKRGGI